MTFLGPFKWNFGIYAYMYGYKNHGASVGEENSTSNENLGCRVEVSVYKVSRGYQRVYMLGVQCRSRITHYKPTTTSVHGVLTSEHPEVSSCASLGGSFAQL